MATAHLGLSKTAILAAQVSVGAPIPNMLSMSILFVSTHNDSLDVNECLSNNGGCHSERTCINTAGGRICGNCPSGYINDNDADCIGQSRSVLV